MAKQFFTRDVEQVAEIVVKDPSLLSSEVILMDEYTTFSSLSTLSISNQVDQFISDTVEKIIYTRPTVYGLVLVFDSLSLSVSSETISQNQILLNGILQNVLIPNRITKSLDDRLDSESYESKWLFLSTLEQRLRDKKLSENDEAELIYLSSMEVEQMKSMISSRKLLLIIHLFPYSLYVSFKDGQFSVVKAIETPNEMFFGDMIETCLYYTRMFANSTVSLTFNVEWRLTSQFAFVAFLVWCHQQREWKKRYPLLLLDTILVIDNDTILSPSLYIERLDLLHPMQTKTFANLVLAHSFAFSQSDGNDSRLAAIFKRPDLFDGGTAVDLEKIADYHFEQEKGVSSSVDLQKIPVIIPERDTRDWQDFFSFFYSLSKLQPYDGEGDVSLYQTDYCQNADILQPFFTFSKLKQEFAKQQFPFLYNATEIQRRQLLKLIPSPNRDVSRWRFQKTWLFAHLYIDRVIERGLFIRDWNLQFTTPFALGYDKRESSQYQFQLEHNTATKLQVRPLVVDEKRSLNSVDVNHIDVVQEFSHHFYPYYGDNLNVRNRIFYNIVGDDALFVLRMYARMFATETIQQVLKTRPPGYWSNLFYIIAQFKHASPTQWKKYVCLFFYHIARQPEDISLDEEFSLPSAEGEDELTPTKKKTTVIRVRPTLDIKHWKDREQSRKQEFKQLYKEAMKYNTYVSAHSSLYDTRKKLAQHIELLEKMISLLHSKEEGMEKRNQLKKIKDLQGRVDRYIDRENKEEEQRTRTLLVPFPLLQETKEEEEEEETTEEKKDDTIETLVVFLENSKSAMNDYVHLPESQLELFYLYLIFFKHLYSKRGYVEPAWYRRDDNILIGFEPDFLFAREMDQTVSRHIFKRHTRTEQDTLLFFDRKKSESFGADAILYCLEKKITDDTAPVVIISDASLSQTIRNDLLCLPWRFAQLLSREFLKKEIAPNIERLVNHHFMHYLKLVSSIIDNEEMATGILVENVLLQDQHKRLTYLPLPAPLITFDELYTELPEDFQDLSDNEEKEDIVTQTLDNSGKYLLLDKIEPQSSIQIGADDDEIEWNGIRFIYAIRPGDGKRIVCAIETDIALIVSSDFVIKYIDPTTYNSTDTRRLHLEARPQPIRNCGETLNYIALDSWSAQIIFYAKQVWNNTTASVNDETLSWLGKHYMSLYLLPPLSLSSTQFQDLGLSSRYLVPFLSQCLDILDVWADRFRKNGQQKSSLLLLNAFIQDFIDAFSKENGYLFIYRFQNSADDAPMKISKTDTLPRLVKSFITLLPRDNPLRAGNELTGDEMERISSELTSSKRSHILWIDGPEEKISGEPKEGEGEEEDEDEDAPPIPIDSITRQNEKGEVRFKDPFHKSIFLYAQGAGFLAMRNLVDFIEDHPPLPIDNEAITGVIELIHSTKRTSPDTDGVVKLLYRILNRESIKTVLVYLKNTLRLVDSLDVIYEFQQQPSVDISLTATEKTLMQLDILCAYLFGLLQNKSKQTTWNFYALPESWKNPGKQIYLVPIPDDHKQRPGLNNENIFGKVIQEQLYDSLFEIIGEILLPTMIAETFSGFMDIEVSPRDIQELIVSFFESLRDRASSYATIHRLIQETSIKKTKEERDNSVRRLVNSDLAKKLSPELSLLFSESILEKRLVPYSNYYTTSMGRKVIDAATKDLLVKGRNLNAAIYLAVNGLQKLSWLRMPILSKVEQVIELFGKEEEEQAWKERVEKITRIIIPVKVVQNNAIELPSAVFAKASEDIAMIVNAAFSTTFKTLEQVLTSTEEVKYKRFLEKSLVILIKFKLAQKPGAPESHYYYEPVVWKN